MGWRKIVTNSSKQVLHLLYYVTFLLQKKKKKCGTSNKSGHNSGLAQVTIPTQTYGPANENFKAWSLSGLYMLAHIHEESSQYCTKWAYLKAMFDMAEIHAPFSSFKHFDPDLWASQLKLQGLPILYMSILKYCVV